MRPDSQRVVRGRSCSTGPVNGSADLVTPLSNLYVPCYAHTCARHCVGTTSAAPPAKNGDSGSVLAYSPGNDAAPSPGGGTSTTSMSTRGDALALQACSVVMGLALTVQGSGSRIQDSGFRTPRRDQTAGRPPRQRAPAGGTPAAPACNRDGVVGLWQGWTGLCGAVRQVAAQVGKSTGVCVVEGECMARAHALGQDCAALDARRKGRCKVWGVRGWEGAR
eukprot:365577-Chlamydomonas_euryale.AAC.5